jgi:hypothetical protein
VTDRPAEAAHAGRQTSFPLGSWRFLGVVGVGLDRRRLLQQRQRAVGHLRSQLLGHRGCGEAGADVLDRPADPPGDPFRGAAVEHRQLFVSGRLLQVRRSRRWRFSASMSAICSADLPAERTRA